MTDPRARLLHRWTPHDWLLVVLGVVGLGVYFLGYPTQHPDGAAAYRLQEEQAVERAEEFLERHRFDLDGLVGEAELRRYPELLDSLQRTIGRRETVRQLGTDLLDRLPAFHWRIVWRPERGTDQPAQDPDSEEEPGDDTRYIVRLTQEGEAWSLENLKNVMPGNGIDRNALERALLPAGPARDAAPDASPGLRAVTDSALTALLAFNVGDTVRAAPGRLAGLQAGQRQLMGREEAIRLARHFLESTPVGGPDFAVDTVRALPNGPGSVARVVMTSRTPLHGQTARAEVDVAATGALVRLNVSFNPDRRAARSNLSEGIVFAVEEDDVSAGIKGLIYFVLVVMLLFAFFRRLKGRVIDTGAAGKDALVGGLAAGVVMVNALALQTMEEFGQPLYAFFVILITLLLTGLGAALLTFFVSGAADSMSRAVWPEKVETLSLLRQATFHNRPVGQALVRGLALAGLLAGLNVLLLMALPGARIGFDADSARFGHDIVLSPVTMIVSWEVWSGMILLMLLLLGAGTMLYRWKRQAWVVVPVLVLLFAFLRIVPDSLQPVWAGWVVSGVAGLVLVQAFWRYDFLTCFTGIVFLGVIWGTSEGWAVTGSPQWVDVAVAYVLVAVTLVVGLVGAWSGKTGEEVPQYVPPYVEELAREERIKGELDIARQVHLSFLPRKMPRMAGLDVAAMCLAAQDVGGDYYDFVELDDHRLAVVIGDVSGKGIQAAFYMTLVKGFLRTLCRETDSPAEVLRRMNRLFCENTRRGTFISMIYGIVDTRARTFVFARAGHNPVILKRSPSQVPDLLQPTGIAIGMVADRRFDDSIEESTIRLRQGDVLVFYTDGFSEAMNKAREQFGDDRLVRRISEVGHRSANEVLSAVAEEVHHFVEGVGRHDDMTMMVVKVVGPMPADPAFERSAEPATHGNGTGVPVQRP